MATMMKLHKASGLQATMKAGKLCPQTTSSRLLYQRCGINKNARSFSTSRPAKAGSYPTAGEVEAIFKNMETGNYQAMFERVRPDVDWTVMGTHPLAARYRSMQDFQKNTLARLSQIMKPPGIHLKVRQVTGGGPDSPWATVELIADAECKNGLQFENTYAWVIRFDEHGLVAQVRAYLDSTLVADAMHGNAEDGAVENKRAPVNDD